MTDDQLKHAGVKGMKWGVRKDESPSGVVFSKALKDGGSLSVTKNPPSSISRFLSAINPAYRESSAKHHNFTLRDKDGKKVGDASFHQDSADSLNLEWVGVKSAHRGKGYASAALKGVVDFAESKGLKKLTLEVPGNSPDALHIYEKLGFKKTDSSDLVSDDAFWGGLTRMELNVKTKTLKHSDLDPEEVFEYIYRALNQVTTESEDAMAQSSDSFAHAGVKGMRWGVRKGVGSPRAGKQLKGTGQSVDSRRVQKIRKKKVSQMSNDELRALTTRMQLEQSYNRLNPSTVKKGAGLVKNVIGAVAFTNSVLAAANSPAAKASAKLIKDALNKSRSAT